MSSTLNCLVFSILNMKLLSERLSSMLEENEDLDQGKLVEYSGASKSVVSQWLSGAIKSMRLDYALELERMTGYCHIWLVLGTGEKKKAPAMSFSSLSGTEAQLVMIYRQLDTHQQHELESIANTMANGESGHISAANPYPNAPGVVPPKGKSALSHVLIIDKDGKKKSSA